MPSRLGSSLPAKFAVLAPSFPPAFRGGGPARTLEALTRAAPPTARVHVFAPDRDWGESVRLEVTSNRWSENTEFPLYYASTDKSTRLIGMYAQLRRLKPDVLYLNSLFNFKFSILPRLLVMLRYLRPQAILLAPRGELDGGALTIKSRKKRAFLRFYRSLGLHRSVVWHASSDREAEAISSVWGRSTAVLVRENETSLPTEALPPHQHDGPLRAAFISRVSPKKGLLIALRALEAVKSPVEFDIYGPEEDSAYVSECRSAADLLPSTIRVRFCGPIPPSTVRQTLAKYDVMLFPTAGENFGHVIAESLSASCPVAVSNTTPWSALLQSGGGLVIDPNGVDEWSRAINQLAALSADERYVLKAQAREAYAKWRTTPPSPHVFTLLMDYLQH